MAIPRASLTAVLLVALAALALYPESIRQQLLQHLPPQLSILRDLLRRDINSASSHNTLPHELDYDALRRYVDANSRNALRWGTYRPGLYFGVRSRSYPQFVAAGLLWTSQHEDISQLRHECRQEDRLQSYGWREHDGRTYGLQSIEDQFNRVALRTHYVRLNDLELNGWAARIEASHLEPRDARLRKKHVAWTKLSLFFYVELGCEDESLDHACRMSLMNRLDVVGHDDEAVKTQACVTDDGDSALCHQLLFASAAGSGDDSLETAPLRFQATVQLQTRAHVRSTELRFAGLQQTNVLNVKERLQALAERSDGLDAAIYLDNTIEDSSTLLVVQAIVEVDTAAFAVGDVTLDVVVSESDSDSDFSSEPLDRLLTTAIATRSAAFHAQFEAAFPFATPSTNASSLEFAQAAFSNLIGGIGYFYGSSIVQHDVTDSQTIEAAPRALFTAVPSRSFFPRGFLWDEGFHQLQIYRFDRLVTQDVIVHWLSAMEADGYIAREQILGLAARRRVPTEFITQHVEHANPPTLLLCIEQMLVEPIDNETQAFLALVFPFLQQWYAWLKLTQRGGSVGSDADSGSESGMLHTFRWRGRRSDDGKLIANTLSSGLDDYPRASTPSTNERHVDLLVWMLKCADILQRVATQLQQSTDVSQAYRDDLDHFLQALDAVHWHDDRQSYFDVGDHSDDGRIEFRVVVRCRNDATGAITDATATQQQLQQRQLEGVCPSSHPTFLFPLGDGAGRLKMQQVFLPGTVKYQHVQHIGYVSIFPLLLKVLPADSPRLVALLAHIADPQHLWSPFGLRSMSTRDAFYERENAPGDAPYWRGAIWLNVNYLALDALHHYANLPVATSPHRAAFARVYAQLRTNVIATVENEYRRTGYLWEQYSGDIHGDDKYGKGQRCHPFSGWTALVVNIMAEKY